MTVAFVLQRINHSPITEVTMQVVVSCKIAKKAVHSRDAKMGISLLSSLIKLFSSKKRGKSWNKFMQKLFLFCLPGDSAHGVIENEDQ